MVLIYKTPEKPLSFGKKDRNDNWPDKMPQRKKIRQAAINMP